MKARAIVAGAFSAETQAVEAVDQLLSACARGDRVHAFLSRPPGRAATRPESIGRAAPAGADGGAARPAGSSVAACAIGLEVAPRGAADGIEVTTSLGPLPNVLRGAGAGGRGGLGPQQYPAGIMVAVETSDFTSQILAASVLRRCGAHVTACLARQRKNGRWPGFCPVSLSSLIEQPVGADPLPKAALLDPEFTRLRH